LSVTLSCFVKHLVRLISFLCLWEEDGESV